MSHNLFSKFVQQLKKSLSIGPQKIKIDIKAAITTVVDVKEEKLLWTLKKFVLERYPVCRKEAVIVGDHFRITMLTTALIRFEYSEDGGFEDRATQMVCNRDFPVPDSG